MLLTQIYNQNHKLSEVALPVRGVYILPAFILVLFGDSLIFNTLVFVVFLGLSRYICDVSFKQLFSLFKIPSVFILSGCITIAISFNSTHPFMAYKGITLGFIPHGLQLALHTISRSTAILSVVYFALLIHTISEISEVMRRSRVPKILIELFVITYKFIENLISTAANIYTAQKCRLAYSVGKHQLHSFSLLVYAIFRNAMAQTHQLQIAIESRCGEETYDFMREEYQYHKNQIVWPVVISSVLFISFFIIRYYGW